MPFWRDNSGRLTIDFKLDAQQYAALCRRIADEFGLIPVGELVVGLDEMFWNYQRGDQEIGLEWDIWTGFMAVAQSAKSEPLLRSISDWLIAIEGEDSCSC